MDRYAEVTSHPKIRWSNMAQLGYTSLPNAVVFANTYNGWYIEAFVSMVDQTVYVVSLSTSITENGKAFIWFNEKYRDGYFEECKGIKVDPLTAFDNVKYAETELFRDIMTKIEAVLRDKTLDERVTITFDFEEELMFQAAMAAHERDQTLNDFIRDGILAVMKHEGETV